MQATARDLRFHTKELLESVSRGEEIVITFRGKPHAKLIPFEPETAKKSPVNPIRGMWKDQEDSQDVNAYVNRLREGRKHDG